MFAPQSEFIESRSDDHVTSCCNPELIRSANRWTSRGSSRLQQNEASLTSARRNNPRAFSHKKSRSQNGENKRRTGAASCRGRGATLSAQATARSESFAPEVEAVAVKSQRPPLSSGWPSVRADRELIKFVCANSATADAGSLVFYEGRARCDRISCNRRHPPAARLFSKAARCRTESRSAGVIMLPVGG